MHRNEPTPLRTHPCCGLVSGRESVSHPLKPKQLAKNKHLRKGGAKRPSASSASLQKRPTKPQHQLLTMDDEGTRIADLQKALKRGPMATISTPGFRPGTQYPSIYMNYVITRGGLGDYINYMSTFLWIAKTQPHIARARIIVAPPFLEVAQYIMQPYPHFEVLSPKGFQPDEGELIHNPATYTTYINATGAHLMDMGAKLYAHLDRLPKEHRVMPNLTTYKSMKDWNLPTKYAVLTPGFTAPARVIPGKHLNTLSAYLLSKGVTPVYLGKRDFADATCGRISPDYHAKLAEGADLSMGIDLREKTSLLEATEIMGGAQLVLGVDNGLLHFAACTEVPIIFGYTVTSVEHREVRRRRGLTVNINIDPRALPCIGCQSNMRFVPDHSFKYCLYNDYICTDGLFAEEALTWKRAIDHILEGKHHEQTST